MPRWTHYRDARLARSGRRSHDSLFLREFQAHFPIAFRIVAPPFPHFDKQEEVHRMLNLLGNILPRSRSNRLDRLTGFAEHDFALAFALDIDRLLNADGTVL